MAFPLVMTTATRFSLDLALEKSQGSRPGIILAVARCLKCSPKPGHRSALGLHFYDTIAYGDCICFLLCDKHYFTAAWENLAILCGYHVPLFSLKMRK